MRTLSLGGVVLLALLGTARAQTMLSVSADGSSTVPPDQIIASLDVQATEAAAAAAQAAVNHMMKRALDTARAVTGVAATTGDYSVYQNTPDASSAAKPVYQASQTLQLCMAAPSGMPPASFTALVGQLQSRGLLLNTLDGNLSRAGQVAAQQGAIDDAIRQIQAQAAAVAARLGQHVGKIKTLDVSINTPGPVLRSQPMMMMATAAPPPQAAPGNVSVEANVSATIELTPP